jgi:hypothetical protein
MAVLESVPYMVQVNNYQIREESLEGRKHIVVPVIMMKEGVHNGSHGPILHQEQELSKYTEAWNGIPVTIQHPANEEGANVSANSPEMLETSTVGRVFHTHYNDGLRAEAWLDVEKLQTVSPEAYGYIMQGKPLDVSVGVFSDTENTEGEWDGETYESIAVNYRPDHLALLPGEKGACAWSDGCGVRNNQRGGKMDDLFRTFKELNQKGYVVLPIVNDQGYRELQQSLQSKLDELDTNSRQYYLQEVYADYFVYSIHSSEGGQTLYKRGYTVQDNGVVEFGEDSPVEVRRKVNYVTMKGMVRTKFNNKNGGNMPKEGNLCCEAKVEALIAHKLTRYSAEDKDWLMGLEEDQIDKLSPMEPKAPAAKSEPQVNKDEVVEEFKAGLKTIEDFTAIMPEEMKAHFDRGVTLYKEQREALVKGIMDNTKDNFSKEQLEAMDDPTLESIFKSVRPVDYSAQSIVDNAEDDEDEILLPFGAYAENQKTKED